MPSGLQRDLKRIVKGDVLCDDLSRALYSTAACIFQIMPAGVVVPRDSDDVEAVVRYAARRGMSVTARGGGSGLAGQTLGEGIILDFSKYMNRVLHVDPARGTVRVQPGVVLGDLNRYLKTFGLWFPPDPSSADVATLGGVIANNASGAHGVKYGTTRDYVLEFDGVLDDGSRVGQDRWKELERATRSLMEKNRETLDRWCPNVMKNSSGYHLFDRELDMSRLIAGSEGTLALVTEAVLRVIRKPSERALLKVCFDDLEQTGRAVQALRPLGPSALELIDKTVIDLVRGSNMEYRDSLPEGLKAILLCEFDEDLAARVEKARWIVRDAIDVATATGEGYQKLWKVRKAASPILDRMEGPLRSTRIIEDACVHPDVFVDYLQGLKRAFAKHGIDGIVFGHAGSGHVHVNVLMDPHSREHNAKMKPLCEDITDLVISLKGTLSGEHGDGLLRAAQARRVFGEAYPVFEELKRTFDPRGVLNPGKKLAPADFDFTKHLRASRLADPAYDADSPFTPWIREIEKCNGCGHCRTYCPVYKERLDEMTAPRGKPSAFMAALEGKLPHDPAMLREVADTCINCKLCLVLCPTRVDIPGMALEAKAFDVARRGLSGPNRLLVKARENAALAARWAPLSNWALKIIGPLRGIARSPKFIRADVRPTKKSDRKVIYFAGCYADFNDPHGEKRATLEILERNGFEVIIPDYRCCGLAALSLGDRAEAIECAQFNVNLLSEWDLPIVTSAPSCGLMLKMELPQLLPYEAAKRVADRVVDIHVFLMQLHARGELDTNFKRLASTVIFHPTCHLRALEADGAARDTLRLIPELQLVEIPERCCGMAGSVGLKSKTIGLSQEIGKRIFTDVRAKNPTLLTASNGTCCMHLSEGTGREVYHTTTLLHRAYGLSPLQGFHKLHEGVAMETFKTHFETTDRDA